MIQNLITDLVCVNCDANLMRDLAEGGALFDTARGNGDTDSDGPTGFECSWTRWADAEWDGQYTPHIARSAAFTAVCKECEMTITWNAETTDWESSDERSCQQVGSTITAFYQQHEPA